MILFYAAPPRIFSYLTAVAITQLFAFSCSARKENHTYIITFTEQGACLLHYSFAQYFWNTANHLLSLVIHLHYRFG